MPRVFTIPASAPFLPTLIGALQRGELIEGFPISADPLALANATLFLPTRGRESLDIPVAAESLERRFLLAQLIIRWIASPAMRTESGQPLVANTPASALSLADDLGRLMDDMTTRQVSWRKL